MAGYVWGLTPSAATTILAAPAPTATTARLTSATGFYENTIVQIKVGGVFERVMLTDINYGTGDVVFSPLTGPPDTGGLSAFEDRGEIITNEKLNTYPTEIDALALQVNVAILLASADLTLKIYEINDAFGNGADGFFYLGPITDPTGAQTPTITQVTTGPGLITGTVQVCVEAYNFSGQTLATAASNTIVGMFADMLDVTIPAWPSSNITGYHIYLKIGAGPFFRVADVTRDAYQINNAQAGLTYRLNTPMTSGAAPFGVNNTSNSVTLGGVFRCSGGILTNGQTLTAAAPGLVLLSNDTLDLQTGSNIVATGIGGTQNGTRISAGNTTFYTYAQIVASGGAGTNISGSGFPAAASDLLFGANADYRWLGAQGGLNAGSVNKAGGTIWIGAKNLLRARGTITTNGTGTTTGGCAGGLITLCSMVIDRSGGINNANGAAAPGTRAGGGGGGIIAFLYAYLFGTSTNNVSGGAGGASGVGTQSGGGGFGGQGGNAGAAGANPGTAGSVGLVITRELRFTKLPRF